MVVTFCGHMTVLGDVKMKQPPINHSPLMDPSACALVLIAPDPADLGSTVAPNPANIHGAFAAIAIAKAAHIAKVPVFILRHMQKQNQSLMSPEPTTVSHRYFVLEEKGSPWSHKGFVDTLATEERSILILAGYWLEHQILATALYALVESYDVYIVLDATPSRSPHAYEPSRERLNQAGATPVVASQVIHEWSLESADDYKRTALLSLMPDRTAFP
jgi:Isochorismatase family